MSDEEEKPVLYCNPSLINLLLDIESPRSGITNLNSNFSLESVGIPEFLKNTLYNLKLKPTKVGEQKDNLPISLSQVISHPEQSVETSYFIEDIEKLIEIKFHNITFQGQKARLISLSDCSAAQRLEKAQADSKYKTLLISTVSHEIRTPVGAVSGIIELIKEYIPKEKQDLLEIAKISCEMIVFHINDLTDYGKMNKEDIILVEKCISLDAIIKTCINLIKFQAKEKGLEIKYEKKAFQ